MFTNILGKIQSSRPKGSVDLESISLRSPPPFKKNSRPRSSYFLSFSSKDSLSQTAPAPGAIRPRLNLTKNDLKDATVNPQQARQEQEELSKRSELIENITQELLMVLKDSENRSMLAHAWFEHCKKINPGQPMTYEPYKDQLIFSNLNYQFQNHVLTMTFESMQPKQQIPQQKFCITNPDLPAFLDLIKGINIEKSNP